MIDPLQGTCTAVLIALFYCIWLNTSLRTEFVFSLLGMTA